MLGDFIRRTLRVPGNGPPPPRERSFLFIVAYGRTGSTVVQHLVGTLPGFHIAGENGGALEGLLASYEAALHARTEQGAERRTSRGDPWYGAHRIDPERYLRRLADIFIDEIIQPPPGARVVGFKEVRYIDVQGPLDHHLDLIGRAFAPARFLFCRRKPEHAAASGWWRRHDREQLLGEMRRFDAEVAAYAEAHPASTHVVDYEAYTADPEALRGLFAFLEQPFDRAHVDRILRVRLRH
jgi:hypothetical protein